MTITRRHTTDTTYTDTFYHSLRDGSARSARAIVPLLIEFHNPTSVVDVGCGVGTWLSAFREAGVTDVLGIDADEARHAGLAIPQERFVSHNLTTPFIAPRQFDLVLNLEVAEHLPERAAHTLVETLVGLGSKIVFSAAVPHQGGTDHLNCQWPSYWARLFAAHGFSPSVELRARTWSLATVEPWYRQNLVVFAREAPGSAPAAGDRWEWPLDVVHPETYARIVDPAHGSLRNCLRLLFALLAARGRRELQSLRRRGS
jgi:SAM-dependent methyltransferase